MDANWLGNPLAMANLYGFGTPGVESEFELPRTIADEWTRLTFGNDPLVVKTISDMQLTSWHVYESYTGPLGAGTLTDIIGNHYDPAPESSERNGWGQWHRADHDGIGMDRTVATGTGYIGQYPPEVREAVRIAGRLPRRSAALFSPRALHLRSAFGKNRDPAHLRFALRGRGTCRQISSRNGKR